MDFKFEEVFMKKTGKTGFVLLVAIAVLVLAGCPQEVVEDPSGDANLNSITIKGVTVDVSQGTDRAAWLADDFQISSMDVIEAILPASAFNGSGEVISASVEVIVGGPGAEVWFIKGLGGLRPSVDDPAWTQDANSFTLKERDFFYVQVTSEDKRSQNYYRVRISKESDEAAIVALLISGKNVGLTETDSANAVGTVVLKPVTLVFGVENVNASVEAVKKDDIASVQYGVINSGSSTTEPVWGDTGNFGLLKEGDKLYVKVIPYIASGAPWYYGVEIHLSLPITIVNIGGAAQTITTSGAATVADATPVNVNLAKQTQTGILSVTKAPGAAVGYALLSVDGTPASYSPLEGTTPVTYTDGSVLVLRVSAGESEPQYYKFGIVLKSNNYAVTGITVNSMPVDSIGAGGATVNVAAASRGASTFTSAPAVGQNVAVTFADSTARLTGYGVVDNTTTAVAGSYTTASVNNFSLPAALTDKKDLLLRVEAENAAIYYYRIAVSVISDDYTVTGITIGTTAPTAVSSIGIGATTVEVGAGFRGVATIGSDQAVALQNVAVTFANSTARVTGYGIVDSTATAVAEDYAPVLVNPFPLTSPIFDGQHLLIRVESGSGTVWYHRIEVTIKSNDRAITGITIGGAAATAGTGGAGVNIAANARGTATITSAQAAVGQVVDITFNDLLTKVTGFGVVASAAVVVAGDYADITPADQFSLTTAIATGENLILRIQTDFGTVYYHRITVTVTP
jgi:hypothetical protein